MRARSGRVQAYDIHKSASRIQQHIVRKRLRKRVSAGVGALTELQNKNFELRDKWAEKLSAISDYDAEGIRTQANIPGFVGTHYAFEEEGRLSYTNNSFKYDSDIFDMVYKYYDHFGHPASDEDVRLTIPKGKNTSWPTFAAGSDRYINDLDLYLTTRIVEEAKKSNLTVRELTRLIESRVGYTLFYAYGERFQHTGKSLPTFSSGRYMGHTEGIESRVRMINLVSKVLIIYGRQESKKVLKYLMTVPGHTTDKLELKNEVTWYRNNDYHVIPLDHTKFDHYVAGNKSVTIRGIMKKVLQDKYGYTRLEADNWYEDSMFELNAEKVYPYLDDVRAYKGGDFLPSGEGNTTNHGIVGNDCSAFFALRFFMSTHNVTLTPDNILQHFGPRKDLFSISWGDDTLLMIHKKFGELDTIMETITRGYENCFHEVGIEPSLKYLGTIYDLYYGTSAYRFVQSALGPERVKDPILYKLGFIVRYELLDPSIRDFIVENILPGVVDDVNKGFITLDRKSKQFEYRPFTTDIDMTSIKDAKWRETTKRLAVEHAAKVAGGIQQVDNILYLLHHGSLDNGLVSDILGVEIEMEYTYDRLTQEIMSDNSKKGLYDRLSAMRHRAVPLFKSKLKDLYDGKINDLMSLIHMQSLLTKIYNDL